MMIDTVKITFARYIVDDTMYINDGQSVPVSIFTVLFSEASDNPTSTELLAIDNNSMGYASFLNQCKNDGVLL